MEKLKLNRKFIRGIYINNHTYRFYSFKYGIYLEVDNIKSCCYFDNMRCALNWMKSYNEFVIGVYQ